MDTKEAGRRGGLSRSTAKQQASRANIAKARAAQHKTETQKCRDCATLIAPAQSEQK